MSLLYVPTAKILLSTGFIAMVDIIDLCKSAFVDISINSRPGRSVRKIFNFP